MLNTDEAFEKIKKAGITHNRNMFLKMVREGKIYGRKRNNKKGYRFEEKDIDHFIEQYFENEEYDMSMEIEKLIEENEELKRQLKMPKDYWIKENQNLQMTVENLQFQIQDLTERLEKIKEDNTIRIRVE